MANPKVIAARASKVSIEAVRNGYRVTVGSPSAKPGDIYITDGCQAQWSDVVIRQYIGGGASASPAKKQKPAPTCVTPSGEYVFPDFASLTAWLRKNITHGGGVE